MKQYPFQRCTSISDLLLKLGTYLLGDELHTEWLGMRYLAGRSQTFKLFLGCAVLTPKSLEYHVALCFKTINDIRSDQVRVRWRTEAGDRGMEYQLRFFRYNPNELPN
jgi:hypothetical protein